MSTPEKAVRTIARGGSLIWRIFLPYEAESILSAEDARKLSNTYGLSLHDIILIAASHKMSVDIDGYAKLMDEESMKTILEKPKL